METTKQLQEWYKVYAKHKDLIKKSLKTITETKEGLELVYKDHKERALCSEQLPLVETTDEYVTFVLTNSQENIRRVAEPAQWERLVCSSHLKIIFVHLPSHTKWILWPALHARVASPDNLLEGLLGLSELVPFTDEDDGREGAESSSGEKNG